MFSSKVNLQGSFEKLYMFYSYDRKNWWKRLEQIYLENIWVFFSRRDRYIYLNI